MKQVHCCSPQVADEEAQAHRCQVTCPGGHTPWGSGVRAYPLFYLCYFPPSSKAKDTQTPTLILFFFFYLKTIRCFYLFIYLFIYLWLCWVFASVRGLSPVGASRGHPSSRCVGLPLSWPPLPWSTGSRRAGSVIVAHGPSCSAARGIPPDQGPNPRPLHWQADSQPLRHQGSPPTLILNV